jgi:hypothetical protein
LKIEGFTFVITTFNSENTIFECLEKLPKESKKIILESLVIKRKRLFIK